MGLCWSIMKTVWQYSNLQEPLYLYLLDSAMFRWLCALCGQRTAGKCLHSLKVVVAVRRRHRSPIRAYFLMRLIQPQSDSAVKKSKHFSPQHSMRIRSAPREYNHCLCCFFSWVNEAIFDYKKGNVLMGTQRKPAEDKVIKQDTGSALRWSPHVNQDGQLLKDFFSAAGSGQNTTNLLAGFSLNLSAF